MRRKRGEEDIRKPTKKPRKTNTARIAEWVGDAVNVSVTTYATLPDERTLRWMYRDMWRSVLEVYEQSMHQIKTASLEEVVRLVADRVATDIILSRYPELPPDRLYFWARRVADVIYADIWRYISSYLTARRLIEEVEHREERVRRPRYRRSHHIIYYVMKRIEEELRGQGGRV
jgi:hypothetical protein